MATDESKAKLIEESKTKLTEEFKTKPAKGNKFGMMKAKKTVHHVCISLPEIPEVDMTNDKRNLFQNTMMRTIIEQNKVINFKIKMLFCAISTVGFTMIMSDIFDILETYIGLHCKG